MKKRIIAFTLSILVLFSYTIDSYAFNGSDVSQNDQSGYENNIEDEDIESSDPVLDTGVSSNEEVLPEEVDEPEDIDDSGVLILEDEPSDDPESIEDVSFNDDFSDDLELTDDDDILSDAEINSGYIEDDGFVESLHFYPSYSYNSNSIYNSSFFSIQNFNDELYTADALESSYVTPGLPLTRNQSPYGTCWAHAAMALAEINLIKNGASNSVDYSEAHLSYFLYKHGIDPLGGLKDYITLESSAPNIYDIGGNLWSALIEISSAGGVASESAFPYSNAASYLNNGIPANEEYGNTAAVLKNAYIIDQIRGNEDEVKKLIKEYGAVGASIFYSENYFNTGSTLKKASFIDPNVESSNHTVALVGWDDNYSKENFKTTPSRDGAWLVRNSWRSGVGYSEDYNPYTYFWISYDSEDILKSKAYAYIFTDDDEEIYDNIYQYDSALGNYAMVAQNELTAANVFKTQSAGKTEVLKAVSFYSSNTNSEYEIKIYTDLTNPSVPTSGTLLKTLAGSYKYAGYYVIDLDEEYELKEDSYYSVVVTLKKSNSIVYMPYEGESRSAGKYRSIAVADSNQSFLFFNTWQDFKGKGNFRIKAFTDYTALHNSEPDIYNINYISDHEIIDNPNPTGYTASDSIKLNAPSVLKGYHFIGWFEDSNYTKQISTISNRSGDLNIYARILPNEYKIVFNANSGSGSMQDLNCKYDESKKLSKNSFTRNGYIFTGWNTKADGTGTLYDDEASVRNLSATNGSSVYLYAQWKSDKLTLTLDVNGGNTLSVTEYEVAYGENIYNKLPRSASRRGYTFEGWYTEDGVKVTSTYKYNYHEDATFYAHWKINNYIIVLDVNGGDELENTEIQVTFDEAYYDKLPIPTRPGYTFVNWRTSSGGVIKPTIRYGTAAKTILYANWAVQKYKINFDVNGGEAISVSDVEVIYDEYIYEKLPRTMIRTGYEFEGWYTESGIKVTPIYQYNYTENTTLHAHWKSLAENRIVNLDVNGGDNLSENRIEAAYGDHIYEKLPNATRQGYEFIGWYTENGIKVTPEYTFISDQDITLYALWSAQNYTVNFDVNGGDSISITELGVIYDEYIYEKLPRTMTRSGYEFKGWYTEDGIKITPIYQYGYTNDITLYAQWENIGSNFVTLDVNGGESLTETKIEVSYDEYIFNKLPLAKRSGYEFEGWYTEDGTKITSEYRFTSNQDITLYAHWKLPQNYKITLDVDGGNAISVKELEVTYDEYIYNRLPKSVSRRGYTFEGWYTEDGKKVTPIYQYDLHSDATFYAHWKVNTYLIILDVNGGDVLENNEIVVSFNEAYYDRLPIPTRPGYAFVNWRTSSGGVIKPTIRYGTATQTILYANWKVQDYKVKLDVNGGDSISVSEFGVIYGEYIYEKLPRTMTRSGYEFAGWYTEDGIKVTPIYQYGYSKDITLYAHWEKAGKNYLILDVNGGESLTETQIEVSYDEYIFNKLPDVKRAGYEFAGWYTEDGTKITSEYRFTSNQDITLYAHWKLPQNYKITLDVDGGNAISVKELEVTYDEYIYNRLPKSVSRRGYTFEGWYTEDGKKVTPIYQYDLHSDATFYAHWKVNTYLIILDVNGGDVLENNEIVVSFNEAYYDRLPIPTRPGYAFVNWRTSSGGVIKPTIRYGTATKTTLYANWKAE